jgi:hypothetical protein
MAHTAPSSNFNNTSGPNLENNYGNKGKFSPDQQKERLKVHAIAIATGFPTYQQIIAQWKERFGIEIAEQSEKEWRKSNRNKIEKKKQELIESGDIDVPIVSDKVLADNLNVLMIDNCKLANQVRQKASKVLKDIEPDKLDGNKESAMKTKERLAVFEALMGAYDKLNTAVIKSFEKMSDLAGRAKLVDAKAGADEEKIQRLTREDDDEDDEKFDPTDTEISDEDRKAIAG